MEWITEIQSLLDRCKKGDFTVLRDGEALIENIPSHLKTLLYLSLSNFSLMANDIEKAEKYVKDARENFTSESSYIDEPTMLASEILPSFYQGKLQASLELLQKAKDPNNHQIKCSTAECQYWQGEFDKASNGYQEAYSICKENENLQEDAKVCLLGQGRCLLRIGNLQEATKLFESVYLKIEKLSDETEETKFNAAGELARIYALTEEFSKSEEILNLSLNADNFSHPYRKAFSFAISGITQFIGQNYEKAYEYFQSALSMPIREFDMIESLLFLGHTCTRLQKLEEADWCYKKVLKFPEVFFARDLNRDNLIKQAAQAVVEEPLQNVVAETVQTNVEEVVQAAEIELVQDVVAEPVQNVPTGNVSTQEISQNVPQSEVKIQEPTTNVPVPSEEGILSSLPLEAILLGIDMMGKKSF